MADFRSVQWKTPDNVVCSLKYVLLYEIWIAESNGDDRILSGRSEITAYAHG